MRWIFKYDQAAAKYLGSLLHKKMPEPQPWLHVGVKTMSKRNPFCAIAIWVWDSREVVYEHRCNGPLLTNDTFHAKDAGMVRAFDNRAPLVGGRKDVNEWMELGPDFDASHGKAFQGAQRAIDTPLYKRRKAKMPANEAKSDMTVDELKQNIKQCRDAEHGNGVTLTNLEYKLEHADEQRFSKDQKKLLRERIRETKTTITEARKQAEYYEKKLAKLVPGTESELSVVANNGGRVDLSKYKVVPYVDDESIWYGIVDEDGFFYLFQDDGTMIDVWEDAETLIDEYNLHELVPANEMYEIEFAAVEAFTPEQRATVYDKCYSKCKGYVLDIASAMHECLVDWAKENKSKASIVSVEDIVALVRDALNSSEGYTARGRK